MHMQTRPSDRGKKLLAIHRRRAQHNGAHALTTFKLLRRGHGNGVAVARILVGDRSQLVSARDVPRFHRGLIHGVKRVLWITNRCRRLHQN